MDIDIFDVVVFLIFIPVGLLLLLKPSLFYRKLTKPENRDEDTLKRSTKYARYGGIILLLYVSLKIVGLLTGGSLF